MTRPSEDKRDRPDDWLTTEEVAALVKLKPATVAKYAREGRLRGFKLLGRCWRFRRSDVESLVPGEMQTTVSCERAVVKAAVQKVLGR